MLAITLIAALVLDRLLGEPKRFHPLVGFGFIANTIEHRLNSAKATRLTGLVAWLFSVVPFVVIAYALEKILANSPYASVIGSAIILYIAIGWQSLLKHAQLIRQPLMINDMTDARNSLAMIVSRDTTDLSEKEIAKAASESVLENGADAIFSAIFWFMVAGIPGVVCYRLCNTLDAMWGYKNDRFLHFGWASARADDFMNFIPAHLTALTYAIAGNTSLALSCWRQQGYQWKSPNAGPVMAAGAGAINTALGGKATYHGKQQQRPILGPEESAATMANSSSILHAMDLVNRTLFNWVLLVVMLEVIF